MNIFKTASLIVVLGLVSGCSSLNPVSHSSSVYPLFSSEAKGPKSSAFEDGHRYEYGIGVARNYSLARSAYGTADKGGDIRATNSLGVMAARGKGEIANPGKAYRYFSKAANAGSSTAYYNLGLMNELGVGRKINYQLAARDYRIAAEMGNGFAAHRLAAMIEGGLGIPMDSAEAERLYELAAVNGRADAMARLSILKGENFVDGADAVAMFAVDHCACKTSAERSMASRGRVKLQELAASGDNPARYNLAVRLLKGEASNHDPSEAARLFTLSAREGYPPSQRQLAQMHLRGQAVAQSKVLAHAWLNLASRSDGLDGKRARSEMDALELSMTPQEISEAQKLSRSWDVAGR